jgi:hypothetical protein
MTLYSTSMPRSVLSRPATVIAHTNCWQSAFAAAVSKQVVSREPLLYVVVYGLILRGLFRVSSPSLVF